MNKLIVPSLALFLLALGVPTVASVASVEGCHFPPAGGRVCVEDDSLNSGCYDRRYTTVYAITPVGGYVDGGGRSEDYCSGTHYEWVGVRVGIFAGYVGVNWNGYSSGCNMYVNGLVSHELGCPVGPPPNPGWGQLLP